jgi:mono/diheme cytochrome c family protein
MKSVGFSFALLTALSLSACLEAQKVAPLKPSANEQPLANSATLSLLPRTALSELGRSADLLVIRAFKVDKGGLGAELRDAFKFPVTEAGLYALDGLPLGEIEFQVSLLDEKGQPLAEGSLRTIINPGAQTLPQIILKPLLPSAVDLDLSLALQLVNFPETPLTTPTEPDAVRVLLKTYKCQSCHNSGARPSAGLDLQSYPYKNAAGVSLTQILSMMTKSFTGSDGVPKMPPNNTQVKEDEATVVRNFLQAVTMASEAGNQKWVQDVRLRVALEGSGRFETSLILKDGSYTLSDRINLIAGARYPYTLTVYGPGGSKLYEVVDAALDVPLNGRVQLKVDVIYEAPSARQRSVVDE